MIGTLLLGAVILAILFPDSSLGRLFRRILIDPAALALNKITAAKALLWTIATAVIIGSIVAIVTIKDGVVFVQAATEVVNLLLIGDAATYFELVTALWLINAAQNWRAARDAILHKAASAWRWLGQRMRPAAQHRRAPRGGRPHRRPSRPKNEDEPGLVFA